MLIRSRGEYAEQNAGVNTKTAGMMKVACMTTSFQLPIQSTPFLWSDAGSANITTRLILMEISCAAVRYIPQCWTSRLIVSVPTESGKETLTDAENMSQVREAGRVQLMVQGVLLPELWRAV